MFVFNLEVTAFEEALSVEKGRQMTEICYRSRVTFFFFFFVLFLY